MAIVHIVLFRFKPLATPEEVQGVCDNFVALKDKCVHAETNKTYVKSAAGGINNSPEGKNDGLSHAFVLEFESEEDRKYYLEKDPAHQAFGETLSGVVEKVQVIDFTSGVF